METSVEMQIDEVIADSSLQPRVGGLDADHVRMLEETPENWPPLQVVHWNGLYLLVDGFHRLEAARRLGLEAVRISAMDIPADGDLHALAFALNTAHGLPLSLDDRRAFAERLLRSHPDLANREIGRRCGLSGNTVGTIRTRLEESAQIEHTQERRGRGGYVYRSGRKVGELPEENSGEAIRDLFSPRERKQHRRIARYLERLATALSDQYELEGWEIHEEAAQACKKTLDEEQVAHLAQELGNGAYNVLMVAITLGYEDQDSE